MEGLDGICRTFLEAIPAEDRAKWDRIVFAAETEHQAMREGVIYLIFARQGRYHSTPISEFLVRSEDGLTFAKRMPERAEMALAALEAERG